MKLQGAGGPQSGQAPEAPEAPDSAEPIVVCLGDVIGVLGVAIAMACCVMAAVFA